MLAKAFQLYAFKGNSVFELVNLPTGALASSAFYGITTEHCMASRLEQTIFPNGCRAR